MGNIFGKGRYNGAWTKSIKEAEDERKANEEALQAIEKERWELATAQKVELAMDEKQREMDRMLEQKQLEMEKKHAEYAATIRRLEECTRELRDKMEEQQKMLNEPVAQRQTKVDFVNSLQLVIRQTDSVLVLGPKGSGKTTFMWLLGRGPQPTKSLRDGTTEIVKLNGYVDSIGLRGWTNEELMKLIVLMIYEGIPHDFIMFSTDRVEHAITALGLVGVNHPLIVIMSNQFWKSYADGRLTLRPGRNGVRKVAPDKNLRDIYDMDAYKTIAELNMGTPITHHDNIDKLIKDRAANGLSPFRLLMDTLNSTFNVSMEVDPENNIKELLFRYIYIYETVFKRDKLRFMNNAGLRHFK